MTEEDVSSPPPATKRPRVDSVATSSITPFPYKRFFISKDRIPVFLHNIRTDKLIHSRPKSLHRDPAELEIVRRSLYSYREGDIIVDLFTEEMRMNARTFNDLSPFDLWQNNLGYIRSQAAVLYPDEFDPMDTDTQGANAHALRESLYRMMKARRIRETMTFSPVLAKCVFDLVGEYLGRKIAVFDPFGGWGDRMLGAICSTQVASYECVDANSSLRPAYTEIQKLSPEKVKFTIGDTLTFLRQDEKSERRYDFIFTSPPYFDYEIYSKDPEQSIAGKRNYADWLETFMRPLIEALVKRLSSDGFIAFHVGTTFRCPDFVNDVNKILRQCKPVAYYNTIYCRTEVKRPLPILLYRMEKI